MNKLTSVLLLTLLVSFVSCGAGTAKGTAGTVSAEAVNPLSFNADSAYQYLKIQTEFGPRVPGTSAHSQCKDYLVAKLNAFGASTSEQAVHLTGWNNMPIPSVTISGNYFPEKTQRILLCAHWDSRPWADHDTNSANHKKAISGANDGASGVAVLLEIARQLQLEAAKGNVPAYGIDIVFFDAEDLGTPSFAEAESDQDYWCLGSKYWAQQAKASGYKATFGILLDMVGGNSPTFYWDQYSYSNYPSILQNVWATASKLGYSGLFIASPGGAITDDHIQVHQGTGIPCIDIIDYDPASPKGFPETWHTMDDNLKNIDPYTLKVVGETVINVLFGR